MEYEEIEQGRKRFDERYAKARDEPRLVDPDPTTLSGEGLAPVYGPAQGSAVPGFERVGWPGEYPYTRGIHTTGYRGKP